MRNGIFLALAGLALLTGCGDMAPPTTPAAPAKWTPPYHLAIVSQTPKPGPGGVTLPTIAYTVNSKDWEKRAALVVRFDASGVKNDQPAKDRLIMAAVDIPGSGGNLPANYMDVANRELAKLLAERCMTGTVKINVALVRSSIRPEADDAEINAKRISEWLPTEVVFKNPHPKC